MLRENTCPIASGDYSTPVSQRKQNEEFKLNWAVVNKWSEESRYECVIKKQDARDLFNAITDNESGILPWLKKYL
jgi:hypothetical protein